MVPHQLEGFNILVNELMLFVEHFHFRQQLFFLLLCADDLNHILVLTDNRYLIVFPFSQIASLVRVEPDHKALLLLLSAHLQFKVSEQTLKEKIAFTIVF